MYHSIELLVSSKLYMVHVPCNDVRIFDRGVTAV
jgi:hypothetical protein